MPSGRSQRKAEAGILESDSPETAEAKLGAIVPAEDPDREWLKARLGPLVGGEAEPVPQEESFTAWRRFVEQLGDSARRVERR